MLICPGWCGAEFVSSDTVKNFKDLQRHINRCPKGHASVALLERFAVWLQDGAIPDGRDRTSSQREKYAAVIAQRFIADHPPTDPRVQYQWRKR